MASQLGPVAELRFFSDIIERMIQERNDSQQVG